MGIYIKGMEMPWVEHQEIDIRHGADAKWYAVDNGKWCEIIPVPDHGRLIDADVLPNYDKPIGKMMMFGGEYVYTQTAINQAPTVIPVDREGEA